MQQPRLSGSDLQPTMMHLNQPNYTKQRQRVILRVLEAFVRLGSRESIYIPYRTTMLQVKDQLHQPASPG